jgi:sugar lactone lactonase YvrE
VAVRSWALNLSVPLVAVVLVFAGIVHAQTEQNHGGPRPDCSTTLSGDVVGIEGTLAVGPSGDLFVPEARAGCVIRIDSAGVGHLAIGGGQRSAGCPACGVRLGRPLGVAVARDGTVYVLDQTDYRVIAVRPDGNVTRLAGGDAAGYRRALALDSADRLYVVESGGLFRYDQSGPVLVAGGGGADVGTGAPATNVRLDGISAIAAGPNGVLYLAEESRNRVLRLDAAGTISLLAGSGVDGDTGDGGPATRANIEPEGIAADEAGNVYIAAQFAHRVRRVDPSGQITTFAGRGGTSYGRQIGDGGPASQAALTYPTGLAFGGGNLYILDTYAFTTIRKVDPAGIISTVVGGR